MHKLIAAAMAIALATPAYAQTTSYVYDRNGRQIGRVVTPSPTPSYPYPTPTLPQIHYDRDYSRRLGQEGGGTPDYDWVQEVPPLGFSEADKARLRAKGFQFDSNGNLLAKTR